MFTLKQRRRVKSKFVGLSLFILPLPLLLKAVLSLWTGDAGDFAASKLAAISVSRDNLPTRNAGGVD